jgi:TusA-related sulfurtransferase
MKPTGPIDIMVGCCLPDGKRLLEAPAAVPPGGSIQVKRENSAAVKVMGENVLKNKRAAIVKITDEDGSSILTIKKKSEIRGPDEFFCRVLPRE